MQFVFNAVIAGGSIALVAAGISLIYSTARFLPFAQGAVFSIGAYSFFALHNRCGLDAGLSVIMTMGICAIMGACLELGIHKPLRFRGASSLVHLLSSLGLYIVIENLIAIVFGSASKTVVAGAANEGLAYWGGRMTYTQVVCTAISIGLICTVLSALRFTRTGRTLRAVANDSELAVIMGVNSGRVILACSVTGSCLVGAAGVAAALDVDISPTMGMHVLLMAVIAVIIGGTGSVVGAALSGFGLAAIQQCVVWSMGSQWEGAVTFSVLLVVLLLRPGGLRGQEADGITG